ncbi:hypothetical protein AB0D11_48410 [Streptomyces monashensis]|uniref:hypothetical protein n=1 Tax=Streptomyces monashensis TaxID=1678012 RepID=UPI0033C2A56D
MAISRSTIATQPKAPPTSPVPACDHGDPECVSDPAQSTARGRPLLYPTGRHPESLALDPASGNGARGTVRACRLRSTPPFLPRSGRDETPSQTAQDAYGRHLPDAARAIHTALFARSYDWTKAVEAWQHSPETQPDVFIAAHLDQRNDTLEAAARTYVRGQWAARQEH